MQFFNVGPWEVTVILMIAILLLGPRRMAEITRTIGRVTAQLRKISQEFTAGIQAELMEIEKQERQAKSVSPVPGARTPPPAQVIDVESRPVSPEVPNDGRE